MATGVYDNCHYSNLTIVYINFLFEVMIRND